MPMYAAISFIFVVPPLIKRIVHEKETGVKVIEIDVNPPTFPTKKRNFSVKSRISNLSM